MMQAADARQQDQMRRLARLEGNRPHCAFKELGTTAAAGWAYDFGKGRVCYLGPGHLLMALWNPEYEKIQRNAARWLLRET